MVHFDSLTEFRRQQEMYPGIGNTSVHVFEFRKAERYVLVQYIGFGACNAIEQTYTALYHVTPYSWVREAEGSPDLFFKDLIDVDGDQYPELLMTDSLETAIYEITYKGFDEMESVTWSLSGLEVPC